jgi:hypothetical protein
MLMLAMLVIGALHDNGLPLVDVATEPWNKLAKKSIKLSLDALHVESIDVSGRHWR